MEKIRKEFSEYISLRNLNNSFFAKPENSVEEQEKMIGYAEEFFQRLEIPYRVVLLSSGDMGKVAAKDI